MEISMNVAVALIQLQCCLGKHSCWACHDKFGPPFLFGLGRPFISDMNSPPWALATDPGTKQVKFIELIEGLMKTWAWRSSEDRLDIALTRTLKLCNSI